MQNLYVTCSAIPTITLILLHYMRPLHTSHRMQGIFHRANGLAVVAVELAVFALPFSVVQVSHRGAPSVLGPNVTPGHLQRSWAVSVRGASGERETPVQIRSDFERRRCRRGSER